MNTPIPIPPSLFTNFGGVRYDNFKELEDGTLVAYDHFENQIVTDSRNSKVFYYHFLKNLFIVLTL